MKDKDRVALARKAAGKKIDIAEPDEKKANVIDLIETLNSVKGKKAGDGKRAPRKWPAKRHRKAASGIAARADVSVHHSPDAGRH